VSALARRLPYPALLLTVAIAYIAVANLSLSLAIPPGYATPVWPPSGIALAATLLFGVRIWPGVWAGAALANLAVEGSLLSALIIGSGNTLEALVATTLIRRFIADPARFQRAEEVFVFIVMCALSAATAASAALLPLIAGHALTLEQAWRNWCTWWQGDFAGMLIVAPLLLSWSAADAPEWTGRMRLEAAGFFLLLLASAIAISSSEASYLAAYSLTFLSLPFIIWAAFRFGQREVTSAVAVVCAVAVWYTVRRRGELADVPLNELLLALLTFISIVFATGLVLVAMVDERNRVTAQLRARGGSLEPRTPARVADTLERKLRLALERDEFVLHYQPKIDLDTRQISGFEAMIRWNSPELGMVQPMSFIPALEESGLILEVGSWALRRARRDQQAWSEAGRRVPRIAVNVSPIQLRQRDFVALVLDAIFSTATPALIDLEITESSIMENVEANIAKLSRIRAQGIGVAIDDFGTGYSSLAYLMKLPVQTLKIDRFFIQRMLEDDQNMALVQTII
jgi:EAL domain-containing protein (putative c-di-GMP-specific phosphodiesterase class I)/integral membrane sensor domain MASE1